MRTGWRRGRWLGPGWGATVFAIAVGGLFAPPGAEAQFNGDFTLRRTTLADENLMDLQAYQRPIMWRYDWYTARNGMQAAVGSLSQTRFYSSVEIKLMAELSHSATFLYRQDSDNPGRDDGIYQEAELRIGEERSASLIGWAMPEKRFDNIGLAASWGRREEMDVVRLSFLRQYAEYNARRTDGAAAEGTYKRTPTLYRVEARRFWDGRLLTELDLKVEDKTEFEEPATGFTRTYRGEEIEAYADWWSAERDWLVGASVWRDLEVREQSPNSAAAEEHGVRQREEWYDWEAYTWMRLDDGDELTAGLSSSAFIYRTRSAERARQFDFELRTTQLFAAWELGPGEGWHWNLSAQAGYVESRRRDGADPDESRDRDSLQGKAGTALVLQSLGRHRFLFLATWDLDSFLLRPWDGGAVQLQITF